VIYFTYRSKYLIIIYYKNMTAEWVQVINQSLQSIYFQAMGFLPSLVGAFLILIVGLVVAAGVERILERFFHHLKLDAVLRRLGVEQVLHQASLDLNSGYFAGRVAYWFLLLAFVFAASDVLGFEALSGFLSEVLFYIPDVVVAFLTLLFTLIAANFVRKLAHASVLSAKVRSGKFLGGIAWWIVFIFGSLTAAAQLGIAEDIIKTVITGFIVMIALAGGLAFGLGGKDEAGRLIERARKDWE